MRSVPRAIAIAGFAVAATLLVASSGFAAGVRSTSGPSAQFFEGTKSCSDPFAAPPHFCVMSNPNGAFLQSARVDYISEPLVFSSPGSGRVDSDVVLTTVGSPQSNAYGHCTFYFDTGNGVCRYTSGTRNLAGFHATFVIGINPDGSCCSVIGKYQVGGDDNND